MPKVFLKARAAQVMCVESFQLGFDTGSVSTHTHKGLRIEPAKKLRSIRSQSGTACTDGFQLIWPSNRNNGFHVEGES